MNISKAKENGSVLGQGEHAGFAWLVLHNGIGFRCGYVKVPAGHPWFGKDYDSVDADAHGGLTFAAPDEEDANGWWVGFDCAHLGDAQDPVLSAQRLHGLHGGTIRTQDYVEQECRNLCEQAAAALV